MTDSRREAWRRGADRDVDQEHQGVEVGKRSATTPGSRRPPADPGKRSITSALRFDPATNASSFARDAEQALQRLRLAVAARDLELALTAKATLERSLDLVRQAAATARPGESSQGVLDDLASEAATLIAQVPDVPPDVIASRSHRRGAMFSGIAPQDTTPSKWSEAATRWREGASQPLPIPDGLRGDLESATATSLGDVRLHGTARGDEVAASHGARAVTIGRDIYFRDGELDVESHDGVALLGHEVAHVAQAHVSGGSQAAAAKREQDSTEAAEREADSFGAAFAHQRGSLRWTPTVSIGAGTAMRKPDAHAVANKSLDAGLARAAYSGKLVNAPAFLFLHMDAIRKAVHDTLIRKTFAPGDKQVTFVEGVSFADALLLPFATGDGYANVHRYVNWLAPVDAYALVDRNRPIFGRSDDNATDEFMRGKTGPMDYASAVSVALVSTLEMAITESLVRMSPRFVAATAKARAANTTVQAKDLVPSTHLDWEIAQTIVGRDSGEATMKVADGALTVDVAAQLRRRAIRRYEWQGPKGGPWAAVQVLEPADASIEEVAAQFAGDSRQAFRVKHVGGLFVFPDDLATKIPEAAKYRPEGAANQTSGEIAIAFGPHADQAIAAEAARTPPSKGAIADVWARVDEQLKGIDATVSPVGFAGLMTSSIQLHQRRKLDPAKNSGADVTTRNAELSSQFEVLAEIAGEIGILASQLQRQPLPKDGPQTGVTASPSHSVMWKLVHAATLSHLPATGRAALAEAKSSRTGLVFETLEGALGECATQIAIGREMAEQSSGDQEFSRRLLGSNFADRLDRLHGELAKLRAAHVTTGAIDPVTLDQLSHDIEMLRMDATTVAQIGQLGRIFRIVTKLEDDNWTLFSEYFSKRRADDKATDRMNAIIDGANTLRTQLQIIHKHWVELQKRANDLATSLSSAGVGDANQIARKVIETEILQVRWEVSKLWQAKGVSEFLQAAQNEIEGIEHRRMITQIVTIVGVMVASMGAGVLAEGIALGLGAGSLGAQLVGLAADTTMFTYLNAQLSGEPLVAAFVSNLAGNLATFGALRAVKALSAAGKVAAAAKVTAGSKGARALFAGATLADLAAPSLVAGGVQFAQAEYESLLHTGKTMSMEQLKQAGVQGIAMMIGAALVHHGFGHEFEQAKGEAAGKVGKAVDVIKLNKLANEVMEVGDPVKAIELIREARAHFEAKTARFKELEKLSDAQLAAKGESRAAVTEMGKNAREGLAALGVTESLTVVAALGLDAVVPGHVYAGTTDQVESVVSRARERGWKVEQTKDGYVIHGDEATIKVVDRGPSRFVVAGTDRSEMLKYLDKVPGLPGVLDIALHATPDAFVVRTSHGTLNFDERALAAYIRDSGARPKRIRLIACRSGAHADAIAQRFANELGVNVMAPTDRVWMHEDGSLSIGHDQFTNTGRWIDFYPQGRSGDATKSGHLGDSAETKESAPATRTAFPAGAGERDATRRDVGPETDLETASHGAVEVADRKAAVAPQDKAQGVHDVELLSLRSDIQVEAGLRILDPLFGKEASKAFKEAKGTAPPATYEQVARVRSSTMERMLTVLRDPSLPVTDRRTQLLEVLAPYEQVLGEHSTLFPPQKLGILEAKAKIAELASAIFDSMVTIDPSGLLLQRGKRIGTLPELCDTVKSVNALYLQTNVPLEFVVSISQPMESHVAREVKVLSRPRAETTSASNPSAGSKTGEDGLVVDIGVGLGSFARDAAKEIGPLVQTEYGRKYADPAMIRRDLTWTHTAPKTDVDSVVVLGDALQDLALMFTPKSVRKIFINHINASYPEGGSEYRQLAIGLRTVMKEGGVVDVQWTDELETTNGVTRSRGHVAGDEVEKALTATAAEMPREVVAVVGKPVTDASYSIEATREKSGVSSKTGPTDPVPKFRRIFTFGK